MRVRLKEYLINKLLVPRIFILDKPGSIISDAFKLLGYKRHKGRSIYHFSDIFTRLTEKTIDEFGENKAIDFFYGIGKDLGASYMLANKAKKIPQFMLPNAMKAVCKIVSTTGTGGFNGVEVLPDGSYSFERLDSDKTGSKTIFFSGIYSGILSFLSGKNFDITSFKINPASKIIISERAKQIHVSDLEKLQLSKEHRNNPIIMPKTSRPSFSDLLKNKKIRIGGSKIYYKDNAIFLTEQSMFDIVASCYYEQGYGDFFEKNLVEISEKFAKKIFNKSSLPRKNFDEMMNFLCAFGWGVPEYRTDKDGVRINFVCAPVSKFSTKYRALVINGFLNFIFNCKYRIKEDAVSLKSSRIKFSYGRIKR